MGKRTYLDSVPHHGEGIRDDMQDRHAALVELYMISSPERSVRSRLEIA